MSSGTARATFTRMRDGTAEEYALINRREAAHNRTLYLRVLDAVRALGAAEADPGYAVSRLAHSLQSATRAERDGRPIDYVVAALIHDIGDGLAPYSHGSYAAAVLRPFVSEELCWIVSRHPLFQMHYHGAQTGDDVNARGHTGGTRGSAPRSSSASAMTRTASTLTTTGSPLSTSPRRSRRSSPASRSSASPAPPHLPRAAHITTATHTPTAPGAYHDA